MFTCQLVKQNLFTCQLNTLLFIIISVLCTLLLKSVSIQLNFKRKCNFTRKMLATYINNMRPLQNLHL